MAEMYATNAHAGQLRDGGRPFIEHPAKVVKILSSITDDEHLLAAGWLHDVIEDTEKTHANLYIAFGEDIANLVNEVTHEGRSDSHGYYFPRLKSRRAHLLKFADRLANLSDMSTWPTERQEHYMKKSKFWKDL